jgi:translation initiation factor 1 (eIF-1/SUI1)
MCSEFAALGDEQIESVVRQGFSQAGLQVDDLSKALTAKLDTQHQETLAAYTNQQRVLTSKFDAQESMHIANHDKQQRAIADLHCSQTTMVSRQDTSICIAKRTQKQTTAIIRTLHRADARATESSKKTMANLDDLAADMKQLLSMHGAAGRRPQSDREISFFGEHRDKIMQYLLPFEDELDDAIDSLISMGGEDISTSHAEWLRAELHRMIDSAMQEKAIQHPSSTATSIDEWSYAEDTVGFLKDRPRKRKATRPVFPTLPTGKGVSERTERPRKKQKRSTQEWTVPTSCGDLHISLPHLKRRNHGKEDVEEVALSYTTVLGRSTVKVEARFWRELYYASRPRIHAQLNAFIQVDVSVAETCERLFKNGSLAEFDEALRTGTISPFHLSATHINLCLFVSIHIHKLDFDQNKSSQSDILVW